MGDLTGRWRTPPIFFVDSDFFIAIQVDYHVNHERALDIQKRLLDLYARLLTSDFVVGEVATVLSQRFAVEKALAFLDDIERGSIRIEYVNGHFLSEAIQIFRRQTSKNTSFTDCINMVIMKKLKIDIVVSFDADYRKNGFMRFGIDR